MNLDLTKEQQLLLIGLIVAVVVGLGVMAVRQFSPGQTGEINLEQPTGESNDRIMVHVCGAVARQGVFRVAAGSRWLEVIALAGGALPGADLSALNLAEAVKDGQKIIVPDRLPVKAGKSTEQSARVSINTAGVAEFDALPGIGKATAEKIVELRQKNGPFVRLEQIMEVPRFGKAKFEKIKDRLTL
ncbi:MAG: ComEA family DNA-binding protein [Candidatus Margulisiibacteriota bacterium]